MKTKIQANIISLIIATSFVCSEGLKGQEVNTISLDEAVEMALQNNHLVNVRRYQVEEKQNKVSEDKIKYLPSVLVVGSYQYNPNVPVLPIKEGSFGKLPLGNLVIGLPPTDLYFNLANHNMYNAGVVFYQPVSQIFKIHEGVKISKTELQIASTEQDKSVFLVKQSVEKLYFGLLIVGKQIEEAEIKTTLAKTKLYDAGNAVTAGKTMESNMMGLSAAAADEEQNLLKLRIQYDDYSDDLKHLTGLDAGIVLRPDPVVVESTTENVPAPDSSLLLAKTNNNDLKMASLAEVKAGYSISASKFGYLPDIGIQGGYTYQDGNLLYPKNNPYIGASLKWNIQDVFTNRTIQRQREFLRKQAEENMANTREQVNNDIARAHRKIKQSVELIAVAAKVVEFRREDLRIQTDRRQSGLILESDLLTVRAALAKAESDYFAARLNYRIALSDLQILTGTY